MTKIAEKMAAAFWAGKACKQSNTEIKIINSNVYYILYGQRIATREYDAPKGEFFFCVPHERFTRTTRDRLSALGLRFRQVDFTPYIFVPHVEQYVELDLGYTFLVKDGSVYYYSSCYNFPRFETAEQKKQRWIGEQKNSWDAIKKRDARASRKVSTMWDFRFIPITE